MKPGCIVSMRGANWVLTTALTKRVCGVTEEKVFKRLPAMENCGDVFLPYSKQRAKAATILEKENLNTFERTEYEKMKKAHWLIRRN